MIPTSFAAISPKSGLPTLLSFLVVDADTPHIHAPHPPARSDERFGTDVRTIA